VRSMGQRRRRVARRLTVPRVRWWVTALRA